MYGTYDMKGAGIGLTNVEFVPKSYIMSPELLLAFQVGLQLSTGS